MLHRIINWITNPFKKKSEASHEPSSSFPNFKVPEHVPLSEESKNKIKADLIQAVKEFREKKDFDVLPINRTSKEAKEKLADIIKEDIQNQVEPLTKEVNIKEVESMTSFITSISEPEKPVKKSSKKSSQSKKKNVKG